MTRITPVPREDIEDLLQTALGRQEELLGLVPESLLTMAHRPRMASLFAELASECLEAASVDRGLKQMVGYVASATSGCRYCQAHTAQSADNIGVDMDKLNAAFEFETDERFSEAERDALRLARDAALVPNDVTDEHFENLKRWYSDEQIAEIVGVIALFGWLNRWNDTMATTLEEVPLHWATQNLDPERSAWEVGKHARVEVAKR
jgi:uncharacterized peroxidase-related enzyme